MGVAAKEPTRCRYYYAAAAAAADSGVQILLPLYLSFLGTLRSGELMTFGEIAR